MPAFVLALALLLAFIGDLVFGVLWREARRAEHYWHGWILDHDSHGVNVVVRPDATDDDFVDAAARLAAHRSRP